MVYKPRRFAYHFYCNLRPGLIALVCACSLLASKPLFAQERVRVTLDQALQLAMEHNHVLKAARITILQNQAQEITANLRPNPVLSWDALYFPFRNPGKYTSDNYLDQTAQFDAGISYTFERGGKRQRRVEAARDQTTVTKSQVSDNERTVKLNVATQFIMVLLDQSNLDLALEELKSFQNTVDISEARYKAGDISKEDYLKIKMQLLPFQTDVNSARLAKAQALVLLRELLGYDAVPVDYDVDGSLDYQPLKADKSDLQARALKQRPDLQAAQQAVTAAHSQFNLAQANSHHDLTTTLNFTHVGGQYTAGLLFSLPLPVFDRNQGEIARAKHFISQTDELAAAARDMVIGDVTNVYENVRSTEEIVSLYRSNYLEDAKESRDISEYAYRHGAANLLDFLDAERSYRATQLAYRQALASYMVALEQLWEAVGVRSLQ